jgi:sorting nexin-1/2
MFVDGNDSRQTTTKEACSNTSQEETENSEPPPPPLGPVRNVQGSRYPTSSQQQYAASGRMNTYSSSCDEEYDPDEASDTFIQVTISDPQKVGEGMSSYMAYRITTKTNLKHFKRNNFTVIRRFSDFLGMHEKISEKHSPLGRIIPPAPEKNLVGSTKVKLGQSVGVPINSPAANIDGPENGANGNAETGREFINQRRLALERFMNRIVSHPVLRRDSDVVEFLESNRDLPRATSTSGWLKE